MQTPTQVVFRNVPASRAIEELCLEEAARLERFYGRITNCRVTIAQPHRHHRKGNLYDVRIDLLVPGGMLVVDRVAPEQREREHVRTAVAEAFRAARRRLEEHARARWKRRKRRAPLRDGRVVELDPLRGNGILETLEGEPVRFHRSAVRGLDFEELEPGAAVRFGAARDGARASWVRPLGRRIPR